MLKRVLHRVDKVKIRQRTGNWSKLVNGSSDDEERKEEGFVHKDEYNVVFENGIESEGEAYYLLH